MMSIIDRKSFDRSNTFGIEFEGYNIDRDVLARELTAAGIRAHRESYNHRTPSGYWKITTDSSVLDNRGRTHYDGGLTFELVSPPLAGEAGLREVRKVLAVVNRLGGKVNKSCGLHVHHDVRDWQVKEFKNLLKLYARMEYTMDEAMPMSRRESTNRFCGSLRRKFENSWERERFEQVNDLEGLRRWMGTRYLEVNMESYWRYGTVEFRHHSGTFDANKAINWIILTQMMVQRAHRSVKLVLNPEDARYSQKTPWRLVAMDLSFEAIWPQCEDMVRGAVQFVADRISHFRGLEQAV